MSYRKILPAVLLVCITAPSVMADAAGWSPSCLGEPPYFDLDEAFEQRALAPVQKWLASQTPVPERQCDELRAWTLRLRAWLASHDRATVRDGSPERSVTALELIDQAIRLQPDWPDLLVDRARIQSRMIDDAGKFKSLRLARKVRQDLERAIELDPGHVPSLQAAYAFHRRAPGIAGGNRQRADELQQRLEPLSPGWLHVFEANRLAEQKQPECALQRLKQALDDAGSPPAAWQLLHASLLHELGRHDQAVAVLEQLLQQRAGFPPALYKLGRISAETGCCTDRGVEALSQYLEANLWPDDPGPQQAWWRLGQLQHRAGQATAAYRAFERALELDPEFDPARAALEELGGERPD
ncbi:MAG: tetratricopeptide repeat protein [Xanthomonadaceae bacterium]|nr:tetratricopeptide repeat protein [Xanthomonadaceae bacterium]